LPNAINIREVMVSKTVTNRKSG